MFALISFILGIIILFKGGFRFAGRVIVQPKARAIALTLMAPLVIYFCASSILVINNGQISDSGGFTISQDSFDNIADTLSVVELIAVGGAVVLAAINIYGSPQVSAGSAPQTRQQQQNSAAPPARVPDIMTVAEAAAYMRVSENEVLALINQGKLGAARIGDTYRIARIAIEDFMAQAHP